MSKLQDELKVIPKNARLIALAVYICMAITIGVCVYPKTQEKHPMSFAVYWSLLIFAPLFATSYAVLLGYVYGDARRRGMRYVAWTFIAALVPDAIGILLYFLLRDPLMGKCPRCDHPVRAGLAFCPYCGTNLAPSCPNCKRAVEAGWCNCAYCGTKLTGEGKTTAA